FSSRRRHTRFSRDWSSDVCSSDLVADPVTGSTIKDSGILALFMVGAQVTVTVNTRETSNYPYPTVRVFEADCIISDFTWTNDNGSPSSSDFTFTINGEPTFTDEPYVS